MKRGRKIRGDNETDFILEPRERNNDMAFAIDGNNTVKVHGGTEKGHIRLTCRRKPVTEKITIQTYGNTKYTAAGKEKEKRVPRNGDQLHMGTTKSRMGRSDQIWLSAVRNANIVEIDDDVTTPPVAHSRPTPLPRLVSVLDGPPWLYVSDDALASLSTDDAGAKQRDKWSTFKA